MASDSISEYERHQHRTWLRPCCTAVHVEKAESVYFRGKFFPVLELFPLKDLSMTMGYMHAHGLEYILATSFPPYRYEKSSPTLGPLWGVLAGRCMYVIYLISRYLKNPVTIQDMASTPRTSLYPSVYIASNITTPTAIASTLMYMYLTLTMRV